MKWVLKYLIYILILFISLFILIKILIACNRCSVCQYEMSVEIERGRINEPNCCPKCKTQFSMMLIHNRCFFTDRFAKFLSTNYFKINNNYKYIAECYFTEVYFINLFLSTLIRYTNSNFCVWHLTLFQKKSSKF